MQELLKNDQKDDVEEQEESNSSHDRIANIVKGVGAGVLDKDAIKERQRKEKEAIMRPKRDKFISELQQSEKKNKPDRSVDNLFSC